MALQRTWNTVTNMYRWLWKNDSTDPAKGKSLTTIRRAVSRSLRGRKNSDLRNILRNMMEVSAHFHEIAELSLAV
jgi:hypothetical protein